MPNKPKRQPSSLNDPTGPPSSKTANGNANNAYPGQPESKKPGKRPGSAKRSKTSQLEIHHTVSLDIDGLPDGTELIGHREYTIQALRIEAVNTRYRRARYRLPDGSFLTAPLPADVTSHFGNSLRQFVLYQHFHNHVTQPLLHEELTEFGVDISAGTVNDILTVGHEKFHHEKDGLLAAAREVSTYLQPDDTTARHQGKPAHTLHIGNQFFATFFTTDTKSRVNFLRSC